jgi:hypothetical protein
VTGTPAVLVLPWGETKSIEARRLTVDVAGTPFDVLEVGRFDWERFLRWSPQVTAPRIGTLLMLGTHMHRDGSGARPSQETLARELGINRGTVYRHLTWAKQLGWVVQLARGHHRGDGVAVASTYRATIPCAGHEDLISTAHERDVDPGLNRAMGAPQPREHDLSTARLGRALTRRTAPDVVRRARRLVARRPDEVARALELLQVEHGEELVAAAVDHLDAAGQLYKWTGELEEAIAQAIDELAMARARERIEAAALL